MGWAAAWEAVALVLAMAGAVLVLAAAVRYRI
jgi:hypothetical protein